MSISHEEIKKLGFLARIDISEEEMGDFQKDLDSILAYVDMIQKADVGDVAIPGEAGSPDANASREPEYLVKNVLREDHDMVPAGTYTDDILAEAPDTKDGYIKVKKIL